jgi:flavin-dependent dehydrogenase
MKVSILGAGPAGSTAAYYLACAGVDVELIDRVSFPRDKCCAGGLFNPLLFDREFPHLREAGGEEVYKAVLSCGKHEASHSSALPLLRTFLRRDLDHFLLKKAQDAGSRFRVGTRPEGDLVIDATGARRALDYPRRGVCMEYDFETGLSLDTIRIDYLFMGIMGYCWLFPKKKHVNIGVGAYLPQKNIREI